MKTKPARSQPSQATPATKRQSKAEDPAQPNLLRVEIPSGSREAEVLAESALSPTTTNALIAMNATCPTRAAQQQTGIEAFVKVVATKAKAISDGNMAPIEAMCAAQMFALNAIFAELAVKAQTNIGAGYVDAGETFMRLAFKAQAQCRATAETLGELKNPRPVYAKNVNLANTQQINQADGPQQINNRTVDGGDAPARAEETLVPSNKLLSRK